MLSPSQNRQEERTILATVYANETKKAKMMLAEILGQHAEEMLPLLEWVREMKVTLDDVFDVVGRACVERVLRLQRSR